MSGIVFYGIAPHPPIVLPEVGGAESGKVSRTFAAMEEFAHRLAASGAEVIITISPHGAVFQDGVAINGSDTLSGDLKMFGADLEFEYHTDQELVAKIIDEAGKMGIMVVNMDDGLAETYGISTSLDHGVLVPLYFLDRAGIDLPMVSISMSMLPAEELYAFGAAVKKAAEVHRKKVALIASSDMSHRLTPDAPAGYTPKGATFDRKVVELLEENDFRGIINIDPQWAEEAGECGLRAIIMMLGACDGEEVSTEVLSYEGPFGVGYLIAVLTPQGLSQDSLLDHLFLDRREKLEQQRTNENLLVVLARKALEAYVTDGRRITPDLADELFQEKAGVFVSIKKHGQLRGCIGTVFPTTANIGQEIINNAISAGTGDPRFASVESEELDQLVFSVDVLKTPEPIDSLDQLDVKRYGVIVRSGKKSGLLLPNLEGVNTVAQQVDIARQKAGIGPEEPVVLERFEVIRYY